MAKLTGEAALYDCDKWDYIAAVASGVLSGAIEVCCVGAPGDSKLGNFTDAQTDNIVKKFASMCGWKPRAGNEDNIASAIGFLEKKFPVNYDMQSANFTEYGFNMAAKNHHVKSLAHSPDIIGLFFSIVDQFYNTGTFISDGKIHVLRSKNFELQGDGFIAKVFCGFCNWFGHIMSDIAGSSGGRGSSSGGRGSGIPLPFYNMFLGFDFGKFQIGKDRQTFAEVMTRVFQEGYDLRFGAAMSIPVIFNELFLRAIWAIKRHFYHELPWKDCMPSLKNPGLNKMLLLGNAGLCLIDGVHAGVKSYEKGGNVVTFVLNLNLIAWGRLVYLAFKYLTISKTKLEYERKHIENEKIIKEIEEKTKELKLEITEFLQEQRIIIDSNLELATIAIANDNVDDIGAALNNIAQLFGHELQFTTFEEFDDFMLDPNTELEL